ncbi:MAG TPA: thermostable hemolysin [Phenylobacterium sp.]|nr:thermostable hemolysin [Phenylobacterium sp.]
MLEARIGQDAPLEGVALDLDDLATPPVPRVRVRFHPAGSEGRAPVEAFLEDAYLSAFRGVLRRHYPVLVSVETGGGRIEAAAGVRFARDEGLFLEQYLDLPIEIEAARALNAPVARDQIAEIGNLASDRPGASLRLFAAIAELLAEEGCAYAAATATRQLRRKFGRMGFPTTPLAAAQATRLVADRSDWGHYYAREPEVMVGAVAPALRLLQAMLDEGAAA